MGRYLSIITVNISAFSMMFGVGLIVALLPRKVMDLSGSVASVGYLASAFALTFVMLQIPIGNLSDKYGFKPFLAGGYFLCSLAGLVYYHAHSASMIFWGRMLQGIGEVPIWALGPALLSIQFPRQKGRFMGLYNAAMHAGLAAGSTGGIFITRFWQSNEPFLLFAGLSLSSGVLITLCVNPVRAESRQMTQYVRAGNVRTLLASPANRIILAGILLYGAGYGIFITLVPGFLIGVRNATQGAIGLFFGLFYIAIGVSQAAAGPYSDIKGRKPAMVGGLSMAAAGLAAFGACSGSWIIGLLTIAALGMGAFCVAAMALLNDTVPGSLKGTVSCAFYFFWGAGYFCGPLVLGRFGQAGYWQSGFWLLALLFMLELIICAVVLKSSPADMGMVPGSVVRK